jgi:glycogen debranching enzyme
MPTAFSEHHEWLSSDGLGGFASGTATGVRTRRYHALLLASVTPPTNRFVLVNGVEAWLEIAGGGGQGASARVALTAQRYGDGGNGALVNAEAIRAQTQFEHDPTPRWVLAPSAAGYALPRIEHEVLVAPGISGVGLRWRALDACRGVVLKVRPLMSGRDIHALHRENWAFRFDADVKAPAKAAASKKSGANAKSAEVVPAAAGVRVAWRAYIGVPGVTAVASGEYVHSPDWYRNFFYREEAARGQDCIEDLATPGVFAFDLSAGDATLVLLADDVPSEPVDRTSAAGAFGTLQRGVEAHMKRCPTALDRAAAAYVVRAGAGADDGNASSKSARGGAAAGAGERVPRTIVAGYPWFTDWGRDTFIAVRGLCLARKRLDEARDVLVRWAGEVRDGLLPNRFPDRGQTPEFNAIDASLWFVVAAGEFLDQAPAEIVTAEERASLERAMLAIVRGYVAGAQYNIRVEPDGLVSGGELGMQLTWMDAKVEGWVVTPRIGKPVEIQALWLNALDFVRRRDPSLGELFWRAGESFNAKFWNKDAGCLYDVIDENLRPGRVDPTIRPNQIFAVGGLPLCVLDDARARAVVSAVEDKLLTPIGLRSLAAGEFGYRWRYEGTLRERDFAYHQGTVWPWLIGAFVEAWVRVRSTTPEARAAAKREARRRFLPPLMEHLKHAGLGHVSEIADAESPHTPRGCPFQAWSVGELLRLDRVVLGD